MFNNIFQEQRGLFRLREEYHRNQPQCRIIQYAAAPSTSTTLSPNNHVKVKLFNNTRHAIVQMFDEHVAFSIDIAHIVAQYAIPHFSGQCLLKYRTKLGIQAFIHLDDERLVSSSAQLIQVWNSKTGKLLMEFKGHTEHIASLADVGNNRLVSGSYDNTIRLWDLKSQKCLRVMRGHSNTVRSIAVFPRTMNRIASASNDHTIKIWDLDTGRCLKTLEDHDYDVRCVKVFDAGRRMVSGGHDKTIRIWNVENLDNIYVIRVICTHYYVGKLLVMEDCSRVLSCGWSDHIYVWDVNSGKCTQTLKGHTKWVNCLAKFSDGRIISGSGRDIRVWNADTGKCLKVVTGAHVANIDEISISQGGSVASGCLVGMIHVWE